jgi:hypothetical protein
MSNAFEEKVHQPKAARPVHGFTFPASVQKEYGIKSVGIHELTVDDELAAAKRSSTDMIRYAYERALQALAEVDGKPVSLADGSSDTAWKGFSSQVRTLVMAAVDKVHALPEDAMADFLGSRRVRIA